MILSRDAAGNGPICYDPAGKLPPEHVGYERSRENAFTFLPLYPLCARREMQPSVRPCGSIIPWMVCRELKSRLNGRKLVPDQCWECPCRCEPGPPAALSGEQGPPAPPRV